MKIALFSDTFPPQVNGVANTVYRFALALAEAGHEVRVFTISGHKAEKIEILTQGKFSVHYFPSLSAFVYPGERAGIPFVQVVRAVEAFGPNVIHTHTPFSVGFSAARAARKLHIPLMGTHHTFFDHYLKYVFLDYRWARTLSWKLTVRYYNRCDLVTLPTRSLEEAMKKYGLSKPAEIVPNILDTDFFVPAKEKKETGQKTLVYMGRLSYEKSVDDAIRAAALVMKERPNTRFLIIGDGPERAALEVLTKELGIEKNTVFTGYLHGKELVQKLQESDAFITGSKSENMPLALLEAMATGLPIVAVRSLGLEEMLLQNKNALLTTPGKPEELAAGVLKLFENDTLRAHMSAASREMSLNYSGKRVIEKMVSLYSELIEHASTPSAMAA